MRKLFLLGAGALLTAVVIAAVASAAGTTPDTQRKITGAVSTGKGTPKANKPAGLNFRLQTTRLSTPFGTPCTPFGGNCVLPKIAVHDDITLPSGFKFNGGILKGNALGQVKGAPAFQVCNISKARPDANKNGIPDLIESAAGPGSKCKSIGGGKDKATGYTRTCGDPSTPDSQAALGRKLSADIAVYNGGGRSNGNGGTLYGRLVVKSAQSGTVIASGAIKVSWVGNKISFEVPDGLVKPFGACAPLTDTILDLSRKTATIKRRSGGRVRTFTRGIVESGPCGKSRLWAFSNTVRQSDGQTDPNTGKVIRNLSNPAVTTATGTTNPAIKCAK